MTTVKQQTRISVSVTFNTLVKIFWIFFLFWAPERIFWGFFCSYQYFMRVYASGIKSVDLWTIVDVTKRWFYLCFDMLDIQMAHANKLLTGDGRRWRRRGRFMCVTWKSGQTNPLARGTNCVSHSFRSKLFKFECKQLKTHIFIPEKNYFFIFTRNK